jgi:hypothetical protein
MVRENEIRSSERAVNLPPTTDAGLVFIGRISTPWTSRLVTPRPGRLDGPLFAASTFLSHGCLRSMASMAIHVLRYFYSATFEDCLSSLTARWNGSFDHPISYFTSPATISTRCRAWSRPSAKPPHPYRGPVYGISRKPVTEVWPVPLNWPGSSDSLTLLLLVAPASERAR